jgi:hypothetical protein
VKSLDAIKERVRGLLAHLFQKSLQLPAGSLTVKETRISMSEDQAENVGQFQVITHQEGEETNPIAREAELQARRDQDAREAEDLLRRERDLLARAQIDEAVRETTSLITDRALENARTITADALDLARSQATAELATLIGSTQAALQVERDMSNEQVAALIDAARGQLASVIAEAREQLDRTLQEVNQKLAAEGIDQIGNVVETLHNSGKHQIAQVVNMIREQEQAGAQQRQQAARAMEEFERRQHAQEFQDATQKMIMELKAQAHAALEATLDDEQHEIEQIKQANPTLIASRDLVKGWTERTVAKQREIVGAKSLTDATSAQQAIMTDTANTAIALCTSFFHMFQLPATQPQNKK